MKFKIYHIAIAASMLLTGCTATQTASNQASSATSTNVDINKMPTPGPTPTVNLKTPHTFKLANGLTVMVVEDHKLPKVDATLMMDQPPVYEGENAGKLSVLAELLGNGTKNMSKDAFNKRVDFLGANLRLSASGAYAGTLKRYFPEVLSLMSDAIKNPKFTQEELDKAKERTIEGLKSQEKDPAAIANRVFNALTYGKNTAKGEFMTEESVKKVTLKDVQNAYDNYYIPNNAYLVVIGDVNYNEVKPLIEKNLVGWKKGKDINLNLPKTANVNTTEINVVDIPNAVQSIIKVGNIHELKMNDPKYFGALTSNYILGGGSLESRMNMNLREKNAFTYGAYSSYDPSKYGMDFSTNTSVRTEVTVPAVKEVLNEVNNIKNITEEELKNAKAKLKGDFIRSMEKSSNMARYALNLKTQDLPDDFFTNYLRSVDQLTVSDVNNASKYYLYPKNMRIFIAGKASEFADDLEKLGYPVKYFDAYGNPVAKPAKQAVASGVTLQTVADNYIKAIGGKDAVSKINSLTTEASAKVQGMDLAMTMIQAKGGKMFLDVKMMGNSMQKIIFDGTKGRMEVQGQKMDLPKESIDEMSKNKEIFPELTFAANKSYTLGGIEKFDGKDSYVVKGENVTYYYDVKTGLKNGEVKTQKAMGQEMTIPTTFRDYKTVAGVMMPYSFSQSMMGQDISYTVTSYKVNQATDADFK